MAKLNDITPPNIYNPVATRPIKPEVDTGGRLQAVEDSYHMGWMGQVYGAAQRESQAWTQAVPDFDWKAHIPKGYESFADFFNGAATPEEIALRKQQIDGNIAARERRDARGGWSTFGTDLATGIVDPINIVAPELRGLGLVGGAVKGAATIGVAGAAAEGVRGALDPTSSRAETVASMLSSAGVGALLGGAVGGLTRAAGGSASITRQVRPVIDLSNEAAQREIFDKVIVAQESSGGKNLLGPQTKWGRAKGAGQLIDATGKAMAEKVGVAWEPKRMTSKKPEDIAYQKELGFAYWQEALRASRGDLETAFRYYQGGPNRAQWGKNNAAYASEALGRMGYGDEAKAVMTASNPVGVMNALQGLERPSHVEVDGRWVPVIDGPLPDNQLASHIHAKSASEILGEVEDETARAVAKGGEAVGRGPAASIYDGVLQFQLKDIPDVASAWARKAAEDPAFSEQLGLGPHPDRADVDAAIRTERTARLKEQMQQRLDNGEIDLTPRSPEADQPLAPPLQRARIQAKLSALQARFAALEARILRDDNARIPAETRRPTGEEIAAGANPRRTIVTKWVKATEAANVLHREIKAAADELASLGGHEVPDIATGELYTGSQLAHEADLHAARNVPREADEATIELRRMDREKAVRDFDSGELADELPFGMEGDGAAYFTNDGEHIRLDSQAILASFGNKPWTQPRLDGVEPFPEDAFKDPSEWLDFVVAHEVEHSVNPRAEGESVPAYENRVNARAYESVQASRAAGGTIDNRLRRMALLGSPLHAIERLVPDRAAPIHRSMQLLASDMAVQLAGNRLGHTPLRGGSVLQRVERWRVRPLAELQDAVRRGYLEEIGLSGEGTRTEIGARTVSQNARNWMGKAILGSDAPQRKTLAEFKEDVGAAYVGFTGRLNGREVAPSEIAHRVAAKLKALDDEFEREARSVNLFNKTKELSRLAEGARRTANELKKRAEVLRGAGKEEAAREFDDLIATAEARAEDYARKLDEPIMQPGESQHYHRIYDAKALKEDRDGAVEALESAYRRQGHHNPRLAAEAAYDQITLDPAGDIAGPGTAAGVKRFELPWTNREAFPYIVRDPELSFGIYARQMGSAIEMTRSFGDAYALDHIDQLRADLIERGLPRDRVEKALQLFEDARDHIVGGFHRKDPLAWDYRAARAIKMVGNLAVLGRAIYQQTSDLARFVGVQGLGAKRLITGEGPSGLIGGLMSAFAGDISRFHPGGIAKQAGEAGELVTGRLASLMMDSDANVLAMRDSGVERALANMQVPYFMVNLMTPWTIFWKEMVGLTAAHNIIDESKQVAAHLQAGGAVADRKIKALIERQAQHGIDPQMAQLIASMPTERGAGGLHLPNVLAWEGERGHEARQALLAAVNGEVRRSIPTPSTLERPRIFDGVFYTAAGREEGLQKVERLREALSQADHPDERASLASELEAARRDVGRSGRWQQPLLSLPFQLHVFAMTSGPKILHGLFSSSERNQIGSIMSLVLAGMTVTYLKAHDPIGGLTTSSDKQRKQAYAWDKMTWGEFAWSSWEYSNLGAIFTDVAKNVTALSRAAGHDPSFGAIPDVDPQDHSLRDEIGSSFGVAPALLYGLVEPFVRNDSRDKEADAIRRVIPFNNVIWWKGAVDRLNDAADAHGGASASPSPLSPTPAGATFGRDHEGAFFAPDPELIAPVAQQPPEQLGMQYVQAMHPDLSNPPPLREPKAPRRARARRAVLFPGPDDPAPLVEDAGAVSPVPPLRQMRSRRAARSVKPTLF